MTIALASDAPSVVPRRRPMSRGLILLLGAIVVPVALSVVFNSWGPLTEESALRMAAATVAGHTISILSAIVALVLTVRRGYALPAVLAFTLIAVVIALTSLSNIAAAGDLLVSRLELVGETNLLNG